MKFSSSFKVGLLTLIALVMLFGVIFRVKGRAFSSADRVEIQFKDVNGMRPGAGVQMMGLRVGQVEEVKPVVEGEENYVKVKFVITDPDIEIPKASVFSIQQSGLIGELFLEITPPKTRTVYLSMQAKDLLYKDDPVEMKLDDKFYTVGKVKSIEIISRDAVPYNYRDNISTKSAYKIDYVVDLPGLILPEFMKGSAQYAKNDKKLRIATLDDTILPYPEQKSPYTIVEPMRISDFMEWQYKAAESLTETNRKINELLSDEIIVELQNSVTNINSLTAQSAETIAKFDKLIDASDGDLKQLMTMLDRTSNDFSKLSANLNKYLGDKEFKDKLYSTADALDLLAKNLNKIMDNGNAEAIASDLRITMRNVNEISGYINSMTKDDNLKKDLSYTVNTVNKAMTDISTTLASLNNLTPENKTEIQQIIEDTSATTCNLRKFSEKLNKRFLLFRLMF
ncbi:MAG: MCE family protein [Cyanobacteria bacterium SIG32]|nr:MCE family protein [Cyanobacteria bacterium SIG32]